MESDSSVPHKLWFMKWIAHIQHKFHMNLDLSMVVVLIHKGHHNDIQTSVDYVNINILLGWIPLFF